MIKIIKILGSLLILFALLFPFLIFSLEKVNNYQYEVVLDQNMQDNNYYGVLEIAKIDFKREFYEINSSENNVNKNVMLHEASVLPGEERSNIILAAHSGNSSSAYFKDLYQLEVKDAIFVYYQGKKWTYEIQEIEYQDKTGILYLKEDYPDMITLITCTKNDSDTQTIYYGVLKKSQNI